MRYIAFDVETPNSYNDSMSAIGITVLEDGELVQEISTLVNPEEHFDRFNIELTGITPEMVLSAPVFPELWEEICPVMESGLLIAHNAPFDMSVLAKCLRRYDIPWKRYVNYACTCRMGRACYPELYNHKLNTLSSYCGIFLNHHEAGSDSRAAALLLKNYLDRGLSTDRFVRTYDMLTMRTLQGRMCSAQ